MSEPKFWSSRWRPKGGVRSQRIDLNSGPRQTVLQRAEPIVSFSVSQLESLDAVLQIAIHTKSVNAQESQIHSAGRLCSPAGDQVCFERTILFLC